MKVTLRLLILSFVFTLAFTGVTLRAQTAGTLDAGYDAQVAGSNGFVLATAVQPDGKTIVVGRFTSVMGVPRSNVARLNANGSLDMSFDPKANNDIYGVAMQADGKILLIGLFTTLQPNGAASASPRQYIARVQADGGLDTGFDPKPNNYVRCVAVQPDGKIIFGGDFTTLAPNGGATTTHNRIARVNANGSLDVGFDPEPNVHVDTVAVQVDGKILLGGYFTTLQPNGAAPAVSRQYVARVNADGTLDMGFDPKADSYVTTIAVQVDGRILLGGIFTTLQPNGAATTTARQQIARLQTDGSLDVGFDPKANNYVNSIVLQADGRILLGGDFTTLQPNGAATATARPYLARVQADGSLDMAFDPEPNNSLRGVAVQADGKILLGGYFTALQPNGAATATPRNLIARLNNDDALQNLTAPDETQAQWQRSGASPEVSQVTLEQSIDGGGTWTSLGNGTRVDSTANWQFTGLTLPATGILRVRGRTMGGFNNSGSGVIEQLANIQLTGGVDVTFNPIVDEQVEATAVQPDAKILIGGGFVNVSGKVRFGIARLNTDGSVDTAFDPSADATVTCLAIQPDGKILVGGSFTMIGGGTQPSLARLNADGTLDTTFTPPPLAAINCILTQTDGKIVVGGFNAGLVRLESDGTQDPSFTSSISSGIFTIVQDANGKLLIGGIFHDVHNFVERLNPNGSVDQSFTVTPDASVHTLAVQADGQILIAGFFSQINGVGHSSIARVDSTGALDLNFDPGAVSGVETMALQADGKVVIGGSLIAVGGVQSGLARIGADGMVDTTFAPGLSGSIPCVAIQANGGVLVGAYSDAHGGTPVFVRLYNGGATQSLDVSLPSQAQWLRSGTAPEVTRVTFEHSLDAGATWTLLGDGTRIDGGWQFSGAGFSGYRGLLRARGYTRGGEDDGSGGLIEQIASFDLDTFTVPPVLTAPATNSATKSPVSVDFTLPETALAGSVTLRFQFSSGQSQLLTLASSQESAGKHTFTFDPANPTASPQIRSGPAIIDYPTYTVILSYQDTLGHPAATATNTNVKIDTVTNPDAGLTFPQSGGTMGGPVAASNAYASLLINLPETALPGSVKFTFDDGTHQYVLTTTAAVTVSGTNQIILNPADPVGTGRLVFAGSAIANAAAFASGVSIPDGGPYSVSFTYQDAVGNPAATSNIATDVTVDTVTQTPTLTLPAANAAVGNPVTVAFNLPEAGSSGLLLKFGATALLLADALTSAGDHSFTFDPADPVGSSAGAITNGSAIPDGLYAVTLSYRDTVFNPAATATNASVRIDTTAPTIGGTFSPFIVFAGTALPDYTGQAMTSDATSVGVTQSPAIGTILSVGTVTVTLTATDAAMNTSSTSFDILVRPANPMSTTQFAPGNPAPGAGTNGLPADALLASFGVPATDDAGDLAFLAKWSSATGGKGSGLFTNSSCLGIVGGDAPIAGAKYKSFTDPVADNGHVACIAALAGTPKPPASVVLSNAASGGALEVIAQAGGTATADGAKFKSFKAVAISNDYAAVFAQLAMDTGTTPKTTAANDLGLWIKDGSDPLTLALREGQTVAGKVIKTLVSFAPGAGSPGQGRGWLSSQPAIGGKVLALALFTDKSQGIVAVDASDIAHPIVLSLTGQAGDGSPDLTGATFASYSLPILSDFQASAFLASLAVGQGGVTKTNAHGIFSKPALTGDYAALVRLGDAAVSGAKFSVLKDPVLARDSGIAFPATIKGGTVKGLAATTLWWQPPGGTLGLLAQGGAATVGDLPGAQWKAFTSLAIAAYRGPIFAATLVPGKGGVTAKNATGVWATDFTNAPRLLFRIGDVLGGKTVKSFTLLKATVGSTGVTRSFNNAAQVAWLATFTDKSQAIVVTEVP